VNQEEHKVASITGNQKKLREQLHRKGEEDFHHQLLPSMYH